MALVVVGSSVLYFGDESRRFCFSAALLFSRSRTGSLFVATVMIPPRMLLASPLVWLGKRAYGSISGTGRSRDRAVVSAWRCRSCGPRSDPSHGGDLLSRIELPFLPLKGRFNPITTTEFLRSGVDYVSSRTSSGIPTYYDVVLSHSTRDSRRRGGINGQIEGSRQTVTAL